MTTRTRAGVHSPHLLCAFQPAKRQPYRRAGQSETSFTRNSIRHMDINLRSASQPRHATRDKITRQRALAFCRYAIIAAFMPVYKGSQRLGWLRAWFAGGAYGKIRSNGGARWRGHGPCWNGVMRSLSQVQNVIAAKDRGGERLQRDRVSTSALSPLLRGGPCLACTSLIFQ